MRVRLTDIKRTKKRREKKPQAPRFVEVDALAIGRGTDCDVHLSGLDVKYHHLAIVARAGKVFAEKRDADAVLIERRDASGRVERSEVSDGRELSPGDVLRVGRYEITVAPPAADEALALEIEEVAKPTSDRDEVEKRYERGIERGLLQRRPLSWAIAALILAVFLAAPLAVSWNEPAAGAPAAAGGAARGDGAAVPPPERSVARLLQETWNVGPISSQHAGVPCQSCHAVAWERVSDAACAALGCHADVGAHVDELGEPAWDVVLRDGDGASLASCMHCHAEHRGDAALVRTDDGDCTSCHADLIDAKVPHPAFLAVEDLERHPELRPSLIEVETIAPAHPPAATSVRQACGESAGAARPGRERAPAAKSDAKERCEPVRERLPIGSPELLDWAGGLIFPHDVHLAANLRGFTKDQTTQLECASCHSLATGGEVMTKVSYEKSCQGCHWHNLRFSEASGAVEAPHPASLDEVRRVVREFFLAEEMRGLPPEPTGAPGGFRRPGAERRALVESARERAERRAALETTALIDGQCRSCHQLDGEGETLRVRPVFLIPLDAADRWLPYAAFDHEAHADVRYPPPSNAKISCESCHAARDPETGHRAELVLLPPMEECRKCHVGEGAATGPGLVASSCLMCHEFHHKGFGPMSAGERTAAALRMFPASRDRAS